MNDPVQVWVTGCDDGHWLWNTSMQDIPGRIESEGPVVLSQSGFVGTRSLKIESKLNALIKAGQLTSRFAEGQAIVDVCRASRRNKS